jgi:uncharacterized protein (TIGR00369 family)
VQIDLPHRATSGFDGLLGLEYTVFEEGHVEATLEVRDELKQAAGLVHGGVYAAIAESIASVGTAMQVLPEGKAAMGLSNQTSFLRPITQGIIHARALRRHAGRSTWVWEVEILDDEDRLCVLTRMTVAVRER